RHGMNIASNAPSAPDSGLPWADHVRMVHFLTLDERARSDAIRRLASLGWSVHGISHATGLSVEQIARVLAEAAPAWLCSGPSICRLTCASSVPPRRALESARGH